MTETKPVSKKPEAPKEAPVTPVKKQVPNGANKQTPVKPASRPAPVKRAPQKKSGLTGLITRILKKK